MHSNIKLQLNGDIEWQVFETAVPYPDAVAMMEDRVAAVIAGQATGCVWCMEHPSCYTGGTSAKDCDILDAKFPVYQTGRGGEYTYHGPGQLVVYPILNLKLHMHNAPDLRAYVWQLEQLIIDVLGKYNIHGERRQGRVGIWVVNKTTQREEKIAAIGVRVRQWVAFHGLSINVNPDLSHFNGIVPCGLRDFGVTSMGQNNIMADVINTLRATLFSNP